MHRLEICKPESIRLSKLALSTVMACLRRGLHTCKQVTTNILLATQTAMFGQEFKQFKKLGPRQVLMQILNFASVLATGLMIWKGLGLITNTESPIVVVLSGSMEPAFYRGDLLWLTNPPDTPYLVGDITVYKIPGKDIPIVHRVLETHQTGPNPTDQSLLTKGDNNHLDDLELYEGLRWLERKHVIGKVNGFLPYVGYVTIAMNDIPQLKYALLGGLGLLALIQRES